MGTRMLIVLALLSAPAGAHAGGHRAEAAATYSLVSGSRLDGPGISFSVPICDGPYWNPTANCEEDWSFVGNVSYLKGDLQEDGKDLDVRVPVVLIGVRYTPTTWEKLHIVPVIQGLVGLVGIKDVTAGQPVRFGERAWGLTAGGALGVEFKLPGDVVRLRVQGDALFYRLGDGSHGGVGLTAAISIGFPHHH
jgi:hypothetical protein